MMAAQRFANIAHMDGLEFVSNLKEQVHLTLTSPPYDGIRKKRMVDEDWLRRLGEEIYEHTVENGVAVLIMRDSHQGGKLTGTTRKLTNNWESIGWHEWADVIYHRHGKPGAWWTYRLRADHEYIKIFVKQEKKGTIKPRVFNKPMVPAIHAGKEWHGTQTLSDGTRVKIEKKKQKPEKCRGTVWFFGTSNQEGNKLKMKHTSTFPDQLAIDVIEIFSKPGDIVLDPMAGSGTTPAMAVKLGRNYYASDIDEESYEIIKQRVNEAIQSD